MITVEDNKPDRRHFAASLACNVVAAWCFDWDIFAVIGMNFALAGALVLLVPKYRIETITDKQKRIRSELLRGRVGSDQNKVAFEQKLKNEQFARDIRKHYPDK